MDRRLDRVSPQLDIPIAAGHLLYRCQDLRPDILDFFSSQPFFPPIYWGEVAITKDFECRLSALRKP